MIETAQGDAARFSPDWVRLILEAAPRLQLRPRLQEAVAPYVPPATYPTTSPRAAPAATRSRSRVRLPSGSVRVRFTTAPVAWANGAGYIV